MSLPHGEILSEATLVSCKELGPCSATGYRPGLLAGRPGDARSREKVDLVRLYKFRALINLDGGEPEGPPRPYPSGTHALMVRCARLGEPAVRRYFPAAIYRADEGPLNPGDTGVVVTIEIADDEACDFLGPGQPVTLWNGSDMAHGIISRRVFFTTMP